MFERIPDRVSADLRAYEAANDKPAPSAEDLRDARLECEEELLAGKRIGRLDLEAILDAELDANYAATLRKLYEHFAGIGTDSRVDENDRALRASEWMTRIVRAHITEEIVEERAEQIARQRQEDCE